MTRETPELKFRRTLQAAVAMIALISALVTAGSNSTTLPNGAELTVVNTSPVTGTEFEVPPGQPSINVPVTGTASVGLGEPDATFIYVMDISGSTGVRWRHGLLADSRLRKGVPEGAEPGSASTAARPTKSASSCSARRGDSRTCQPAGGDQTARAPTRALLNTVIDSTFP